jgi:hypothetical protein
MNSVEYLTQLVEIDADVLDQENLERIHALRDEKVLKVADECIARCKPSKEMRRGES